MCNQPCWEVLAKTHIIKPDKNSISFYEMSLVFMRCYCSKIHSEKFEMTEEVDSLLSEKVSNFLLT